jgi:hypothetical protein
LAFSFFHIFSVSHQNYIQENNLKKLSFYQIASKSFHRLKTYIINYKNTNSLYWLNGILLFLRSDYSNIVFSVLLLAIDLIFINSFSSNKFYEFSSFIKLSSELFYFLIRFVVLLCESINLKLFGLLLRRGILWSNSEASKRWLLKLFSRTLSLEFYIVNLLTVLSIFFKCFHTLNFSLLWKQSYSVLKGLKISSHLSYITGNKSLLMIISLLGM